MILHALFNDSRRMELQGALRNGTPIPLRNRAPKQEEPAAAPASANRYEGVLYLGTPQAVCGFGFIYSGIVEGGVALGIRSAEGMSEDKTLPGGRESVFDFESEGKRVRVVPHTNSVRQTEITIVVEDMFAEND